MICVPSHMQPHDKYSFTSTGIEIACTTLKLPDGSHMQILLLYRSPDVHLQALIDHVKQTISLCLSF